MQRRPSSKMPTKYLNGTFFSEGVEVPPSRIREIDRRTMKDKPGKEFMIDIVGPGTTRAKFSRLNPRRYT